MTNPTNDDIHNDVGIVWDAIEGTTTTIVNSLITKAQGWTKVITGTTSGEVQDLVVRKLADAFTVRNAMAGLGPESVNSPAYVDMQAKFTEDANKALLSVGKSLDGYKIQFQQVNP